MIVRRGGKEEKTWRKVCSRGEAGRKLGEGDMERRSGAGRGNMRKMSF